MLDSHQTQFNTLSWWCGGGSGGAGVVVVSFSSLARIWGECSTSHSPPALFIFFLVEIGSRKLSSLFRPGSVHSGSAS